MSQTEPVPEPEQDDQNDRLQESASEAWNAAAKAFYAFVLALVILIGRALQALFVLARPAVLVCTVVAAGYTSVTLFQTILVRYGGGLPAVLLALAAVTLLPATLVIIAEDYGIWAIALATAGLEFLARLGLERAPPIVLALIPVLALASVVFAIKKLDTHEEEQNEQDQKQRNIGSTVDSVSRVDHVHDDTNL